MEAIGLKESQFGRYVNPSEVVGALTPEVQKMTGLGAVPVVAVAGHDTGAAVAAVPAENERFAYLSCGTWSLLGIETKDAIINEKSFEYNFTNEGGIEGTTRFLKNICGMWLLERSRKEFKNAPANVNDLNKSAMEAPAFRSFIFPDAARLCQSREHGGGDSDLLQNNGAACARGLSGNGSLHLREFGHAVSSGAGLSEGDGAVPH